MKKVAIIFILLFVSACDKPNDKNIIVKNDNNVFVCPHSVNTYIESYYDEDNNLSAKKIYKAVYEDKTDIVDSSYFLRLEDKCINKTKFFNKDDYYGDYNLLAPLDQNKIFLFDMEGNVLSSWNTEFLPTNDVFIMPDGRFLGLFNNKQNTFDPMAGQGGTMQIIDGDGQVDWNFDYYSETYTTHHDIELLPNGNILALVWNSRPVEEVKDLDFTMSSDVDFTSGVWFEKIIEINPENDDIVWQWDSFDHLGLEKNKIDINGKGNGRKPGDIMHANGLTYDKNKDLIFMTVNGFSEVWVIDHSTDTAEAASSQGGYYNVGGDLLYRFGSDVFHSVHGPSLLDNGNLLVFSNGNRKDEHPMSTVYEIKLPDDFLSGQNIDIVWSYSNPDLYSAYISGAIRLPNGDTLIAEGDFGLWEINEDKDIVWQYAYHPLDPSQARFGGVWRPYRYTKNSQEIINLNL